MDSALYIGKLRHRRFFPKKHGFSYPVFMAFLDVDRLPQLLKASRLASYNSWNWISYFERDHFGDPATPLRERLKEDAARQDVTLPDGQIFLLTHLRYLGYVFNPVSFFYFYDRDGNLRQMMAEVKNTFGESCNYWLTAANERPNAARRYLTDKRMHVSPFMGMNVEYDWIFTPPGEKLVAHMNTREHGKAFFDATLELGRRPWHRDELLRVILAFPFMTMRVMGAIHWEALRLWLKNVPVFTHPKKAKSARDIPSMPSEPFASTRSISTQEDFPP